MKQNKAQKFAFFGTDMVISLYLCFMLGLFPLYAPPFLSQFLLLKRIVYGELPAGTWAILVRFCLFCYII